MAWEMVAEGSIFNLNDLPQYENQLEEGSRNMLELKLRLPVTDGVAQALEDVLRDAGVEGVRVVNFQNPHIKIYFTKGFPWLAVIVGIILASLIVIALVIAWKLITYIGGVAPGAIPLLALAAVAAITVVGIYLVRRKP